MTCLKSLLAVPCLIVLLSCATTPAGYYPGGDAMIGVMDPHVDPAQQERLVDCNVPAVHRLTAHPASARPGDLVELRHTFEFSAYGPQRIPLHCVEYWQVDPPTAAMLSSDRRTLRLSLDAPPGRDVTVRVVVSGHPYTLVLPVLAAGQQAAAPPQ